MVLGPEPIECALTVGVVSQSMMQSGSYNSSRMSRLCLDVFGGDDARLISRQGIVAAGSKRM
jgi:hypothetical protein